ncbi:hypothetical protein D3C74_347410 [compost metagenome]
MTRARRLAASCAAGIHPGFGAPCPWREVIRRRPVHVRRVYVVSELSWLCMTRAITVRSDQPRRSSMAGSRRRWAHSSRTHSPGEGALPGRAPSSGAVPSP